MNPQTTKWGSLCRRIVLYNMLALAVIAVVMYVKYAPLRRQLANMRDAQEHIKVLQPLLRDEVFAGVELTDYSDHNGSLLVKGEVASALTFERVKAIVTASKPPVPVEYRVWIGTPGFGTLRFEPPAVQ